MKIRSVISDLKIAVEPYLIFWDEWVINENCNLTEHEILTINAHIKNTFEIGLLDQIMHYNKIEVLQKIISKLNLAYRVFKEWVIVKFLFAIIEMAKEYGYDDFLNTPINKLNISEELRLNFKSFKVYTLQQLFIIYKSEDFGRTWLYRNITDFHTVKARIAATSLVQSSE